MKTVTVEPHWMKRQRPAERSRVLSLEESHMHTMDSYQDRLPLLEGHRATFTRLPYVVLLCVAAMSLLHPAALQAQYRTSIQGVVTDPAGAVIPGATLTLTDTGTNEKQVRASDASGVYNFNALPADKFTPGRYEGRIPGERSSFSCN